MTTPEGPGSVEETPGKGFKVTDKRGKEEPKAESTPPIIDPKIKEEPIPDPPDYDKINLVMQGERMLIQPFPRAKKIGHILTPENFELEIDMGRVVAVGQDVKRIKPGDIIYKVAGLGQMLMDNQGNKYIFLPENAAIAVDRDFKGKPAEPILPGNPDIPPGQVL